MAEWLRTGAGWAFLGLLAVAVTLCLCFAYDIWKGWGE